MKKTGGRKFLAVGGVLAAVLFWGCPEAEDLIKDVFKNPEVLVNKVDITDLTAEAIGLNLGIVIDNPNPMGLSLGRLDYAFDLADHMLAQGSAANGLNIQASGKSRADVPVSLAYNELMDIYNAAEGQRYLPYKLSGKAFVDTPVGEIGIPFQANGKLPVVRVPKITDVKMKIDSIDFQGAKMTLKLGVDNPNWFPLVAPKIDYAMDLEGRDFAQGALSNINVGAESDGTISIPVNLNFAEAGAGIQSILTKSSADYALDYNAVYTIENNPVRHHLDKKGQVKF